MASNGEWNKVFFGGDKTEVKRYTDAVYKLNHEYVIKLGAFTAVLSATDLICEVMVTYLFPCTVPS